MGRRLALAKGNGERELVIYLVTAGDHEGKYLLYHEDEYGHHTAELCSYPGELLDRLQHSILWNQGGYAAWMEACSNDKRLKAIEAEQW
jgi:hypothetical protein